MNLVLELEFAHTQIKLADSIADKVAKPPSRQPSR